MFRETAIPVTDRMKELPCSCLLYMLYSITRLVFVGAVVVMAHVGCGKQRFNTAYLLWVLLFLWVILILLNIYELHWVKHHKVVQSNPSALDRRDGSSDRKRPVVWIAGSKRLMDHITAVFERVGYRFGNNQSDWDVLWSHGYPFYKYREQLATLKPYQKVNQFPGSSCITNKAQLASTKIKFIPRAFRLPNEKNQFLEYAKEHPNTTWIQKRTTHRGIRVKEIHELSLDKSGSYVQECVSRPFLIDNRKFDIGMYAILTSIDPLRLYVVTGETLFRFCKKEYYPTDFKIIEKYVITDVYYHTWEMPSLKKYFEEMDHSFHNTFNAYLASVNYRKIWDDIKSAILSVFLEKEPLLIKASQKYTTTRNFFEMMRFDFLLDEDLNVFMLEANMSPNLSSRTKLSRMHEHAIFNLLSLVGIVQITNNNFYKSPDKELEMQVSDKDIQVFPEVCSSRLCEDHCADMHCKLCNKCLTTEWRTQLKLAYLEHVRRGSCRRLFPQPMNQTAALDWTPGNYSETFRNYSENNKLMSLWFLGKCRQDVVFCT